jgi:hypothetical protein
MANPMRLETLVDTRGPVPNRSDRNDPLVAIVIRFWVPPEVVRIAVTV